MQGFDTIGSIQNRLLYHQFYFLCIDKALQNSSVAERQHGIMVGDG